MTRTIQTAAELDALPWGAVVARTIFGEQGEDWHKRRDGMWLGTGGDVWAADLLAVASDHAHMALTLVVPVVPVVSDAAVEAAARAMAGVVSVGKDYWRATARLALRAALPHLAAVPSATREEVADALRIAHADEIGASPDIPTWDEMPQRWRGHWLGKADALLARFTITPRADR